MKKINGKYKNGNSSSFQYSLNYKFDSMSSAGKINGTALELIKKYNELAKEAHSNGDYTEMENFRQYAEHYRKIVTDINEKKNVVRQSLPEENKAPEAEIEAEKVSEQDEPKDFSEKKEVKSETKPTRVPRRFKVVEIEENKEALPEEAKPTTRRRVIRKKAEKAEEAI